MKPSLQKRILAVSTKLEDIANKLDKKPRVALDTGKPDGGDPTKAIVPAVNAIDQKMEGLNKAVNGLLAALNRGNMNNVKTLLKTVVTKVKEMQDISAKQLAPMVTANAKDKKLATTKEAVDRSVRRARAVAKRATKALLG